MPQEITLTVPTEYSLPHIFSTLDEAQTALALSLGAYAYQTVKQRGEQITHAELSRRLTEAAAAKYEPDLESLEKQVAKLKERVQEEQERRLSTEKTIREEERRNREEIVTEKNKRIQSLEEQVKEFAVTIRESSRQMSDNFQHFKDQILKNTSGSKKKGDIGEAVFENILERAFGGGSANDKFDIQNVGKEGHQADLRMNWQGQRIMLEVKNYDRNVDGKEVLKFHKDMEAAKDCPIGLMISLNTGITGHMKAGKVDIEMLHDGRMCVFLNSLLLHEDPVSLLQSIKPFLEVYLKSLGAQSTDVHQDETRAQRLMDIFEQQRKSLLKVLQSHEEQTRKMKNTLLNAKKKHEQSWIEIMGDMRESEHSVKLLVETMLHFTIDDSDDEEADTEKAPTLPGYIFRQTDLKLFTEKERKFIQQTLEYFEFNEDYKVQTKDAKEIYKMLGYSDEALNTMRTRVLQDDVWERGKKEIKYMRVNNKKRGKTIEPCEVNI